MARRSISNPHLAAALHWSRDDTVDARTIAVAALGMVVPVVVGVVLARPEIGFTIGLGAMLLAGGTAASGAGERPSAASAILPAALAVLAATAIAGVAWTAIAMIVLTTMAAAVSGYSRPVGVAAIRFIIYFVLSLSLLETAGAHRGGAALIFGLGALWNVAVRMMLTVRRPAAEPIAPVRTPTAAQRHAHWRRTMRTLAGWQFPIRMGAGLAIASIIRLHWPAHHYGWIVVTVALLTQRPLERVPVKTVQRALGTIVGVAVTWAILTGVASHVVLAVLVCVLATIAPLARARNYLAYSAVSTPVILLVLDIGKPVEMALLTDRLVATIVAGGIVVIGNWLVERWMP